MDAAHGGAAAPLPPTLAAWRLTRLSFDYLLDSIEISRAGGDVVDRLLVAALIDANVAPIKQDAALQFAHAGLEDAPQQDLLRPVSIQALAESLRLPFETVRRRVGRLARNGTCLVSPRGVVVAPAALATPAFKAMSLARYERLRRFYFDLVEAGAIARGQAAALRAGAAAAGESPPIRVANRLLAEYLMRCIEGVMRRVGDPLTGLLLLHLLRASTEHLTPAELERPDPVPDSLRRPVRVARLAERLNVPAETVRRRVAVLEREGFCRRSPQGVAALSGGLAASRLQGLAEENAANVRRLFAGLERLGLLAEWEREAHASDLHALRRPA